MIEQEIPQLAVVGCGYWGRNLVRNFHELGSLKEVCDVDLSRLQEMREKYSIATTNDFEKLLATPELQAIAIAAPAAQHFALAKQVLLADKDVFVEKPLSLRVEEGEELVTLAQKHSRILMVGHLLHYHPAIVELRHMIRKGDLGKVEYVSSSRLNLGRLRTEEDILWSFAPHDISAITHLLGETPTQVSAQGASHLNHPISDVTMTILNFRSGVKAHVFVSWLHPFKEQKMVIVGDHAMAVFDDTQSDEKLVVYPHRVEWIDRFPVARRAEAKVVPLPKEEPLRAECLHFLECVRDRKTPRTDGENGVQVLRILHAASQSIRDHGQPVCIDKRSPRRFFVHQSSVVDEPCQIGDGTKIWHFSHVMQASRIGSECILGQNVHVASGVQIGNRVKIQNNVSVYAGVELEDDVFCGPSVVFTNVTTPRSHINRKSEFSRTLVKRGASLGANSTIVCGITIGQYAFIGAGAVVTRNVPDHALVVGVPARQMGWVCQCGARLEILADVGLCGDCGLTYSASDGKLNLISPARAALSANTPRALAATVGED